jgi:WD40 repeat protein
VWDAKTGAQLLDLRGHEDGLRTVAWSPNGRIIATGSTDRTARLWNAQDGVQLEILSVHQNQIQSIAWSPDGRLIATASRDRTAQLWNTRVDFGELVARARRRVFRDLTDDERRSAMLPESHSSDQYSLPQ